MYSSFEYNFSSSLHVQFTSLHINLHNVDIPWPKLWVISFCIPWFVSFVLFWSFGFNKKEKDNFSVVNYTVCVWIYLKWNYMKFTGSEETFLTTCIIISWGFVVDSSIFNLSNSIICNELNCIWSEEVKLYSKEMYIYNYI